MLHEFFDGPLERKLDIQREACARFALIVHCRNGSCGAVHDMSGIVRSLWLCLACFTIPMTNARRFKAEQKSVDHSKALLENALLRKSLLIFESLMHITQAALEH